jgi:(1->4)-alpha-D-glucan 1-alpha-D-glucosylmutase
VLKQVHPPTATYRLQLNRNFTFRDAAAIVPYLSELGISHVYLSPYLRARPGSIHGYDVTNHNEINPEIGTSEEYDHLVAELHHHGMGQIMDIVPNHMGVMGSDNVWWLDVLENGESSEFADFFDIDWDPIKDELQGKVLIPILADQYGNELEAGKLKLVLDEQRGEFSIFYYQHRFPVAPREYPRILGYELARLQTVLGPTHEDLLELQSIATAFGHLPGQRDLSAGDRAERVREKEVQKRRLAALCARSAEICRFLQENVRTFNGDPEDPRSFELLHDLIKAQAYRLAQWRVAADDINYRRFFDINDLAALRTENETVFEYTHRLIFELVGNGKVDGLRIDHPDGLYDPARYFHRLREKTATELQSQGRECYIVAEKILTGRERLRKEWPLQGTTGYEFANLVNGLFVAQGSADRMERIYRFFTGKLEDFPDLVYSCKKLILKVALASELNVLANILTRIALANRHTCDFTLNSIRSALAEIVASFPVYRTYVTGPEVSAEDRRYIEQAVSAGKRRSNAADLTIFDFIQRVLLVEFNGCEPEYYKLAILRFAMKFQQVTAAVMAKGVEDTAFYRYNRLVSLNEVGGNPSRFGTGIEEFHRANQERLATWPHSMLSSSTHDSKRSEDVRARINVLSEIPATWRLCLSRWSDWNRGKKARLEGGRAPSRNDEYLFYQTLVGIWPANDSDDANWNKFARRVEEYMLKAAREAKEHTSWANTNAAYEDSLTGFVRQVLDRQQNATFIEDFSEFQRRIVEVGTLNSLSQCLLKLTAPGVPDIYQGNELYQFALVDPDNRQTVDYEVGRNLMRQVFPADATPGQMADIADFSRNPLDSRLKILLTAKTLCFRKKHPLLFQSGDYLPLKTVGPKSAHVVAFARKNANATVIIAVPRLCASLLGERHSLGDEHVWENTILELPDSTVTCYHSVFTGDCVTVEHRPEARGIPIAKLFRTSPIALLAAEPGGDQEMCARN